MAIDSGAAFGLTDGLLFVAESNPTLSIELLHIQVNISNFISDQHKFFQADHLKMLTECGLHPSIKVDGKTVNDVQEKMEEKHIEPARISITSL